MANKDKKIAAALAAVNAFLRQEEGEAADRHAPPESTSPAMLLREFWAQSGRQEMMAMRRLIQLRTFTSFR